eukprot:9688620-Prorocentrum_lima.AAC.1
MGWRMACPWEPRIIIPVLDNAIGEVVRGDKMSVGIWAKTVFQSVLRDPTELRPILEHARM